MVGIIVNVGVFHNIDALRRLLDGFLTRALEDTSHRTFS